MEIRSYTIDDKIAVIQLIRENTPQYFNFDEEKDFEFYLDNYVEEYFVICQNFEILGCGGINYFPKQRLARLSWDIIKASAHGNGMGRKLVNHRIKLLQRNHDIDQIVVRTSQHTYKFYQKMGFELTKVEKDYWALNLDLYQMEQPNLHL